MARLNARNILDGGDLSNDQLRKKSFLETMTSLANFRAFFFDKFSQLYIPFLWSSTRGSKPSEVELESERNVIRPKTRSDKLFEEAFATPLDLKTSSKSRSPKVNRDDNFDDDFLSSPKILIEPSMQVPVMNSIPTDAPNTASPYDSGCDNPRFNKKGTLKAKNIVPLQLAEHAASSSNVATRSDNKAHVRGAYGPKKENSLVFRSPLPPGMD